jgi:hypothetical protein
MNQINIYEPLTNREGEWPREDFFAVSEKYPIFIVADGVTLIQYVIEGKKYPNPSPAGDIAKIFCEKALIEAEKRFENFLEIDIVEVFRAGNSAVGEYNRQNGRTKETDDFWDNDLFAATAAVAVIKDNKLFWGTLCDSYVMQFDENGELKFRSPDCHTKKQADPEEKYSGDKDDRKVAAKYFWRVKRNRINSNSERVGYGVVTGEPEALNYLSSGTLDVEAGDLVSVLTDGFEPYMKMSDFLSLFKNWSEDLEMQIKNFTEIKSTENQKVFGHERTLIAAQIY